MSEDTRVVGQMAIGVDLGDKYSQVCVLDEAGAVVEEARIATTQRAFERYFARREPSRVAIEAGTHSPWVSRLLGQLGHTCIVANPRKLRLIYENDSKNDRVDAEYLARLTRVDPKLLSPIHHRSAGAQVDLQALRARDALVRARTLLVNTVRGSVKPFGHRLPKCSAEAFPSKVAPHIPKELWPALSPLLDTIGEMTAKIRRFDKQLEAKAKESYPATEVLMQPSGVGPITALAFLLTIEDPKRFKKSRAVGSFVGLRPKRSESGESDPQLRITKAGNSFLRRLLVQAAQYILGPFAPDSDLRRWGRTLAQRGGKNAKKRAVVAVARKLAVLLHRLWLTSEVYDPLRNTKKKMVAAGA